MCEPPRRRERQLGRPTRTFLSAKINSGPSEHATPREFPSLSPLLARVPSNQRAIKCLGSISSAGSFCIVVVVATSRRRRRRQISGTFELPRHRRRRRVGDWIFIHSAQLRASSLSRSSGSPASIAITLCVRNQEAAPVAPNSTNHDHQQSCVFVAARTMPTNLLPSAPAPTPTTAGRLAQGRVGHNSEHRHEHHHNKLSHLPDPRRGGPEVGASHQGRSRVGSGKCRRRWDSSKSNQ